MTTSDTQTRSERDKILLFMMCWIFSKTTSFVLDFVYARCKLKVIYTSPKPISCKNLVDTVSLALVRPALRNSSSEVFKHADGGLPVNASVGDGDALLQAAGALRWDLLVALVDV